MNYIWFSILLCTILAGTVFLLYRINKKNQEITMLVGALVVLSSAIILSLSYKDAYNQFETPICIEYKGKVPISYIWSQDDIGVYINEKPYNLLQNLRSPNESIEMLQNSIKYDSIPKIDSVKVYQYKYKPLMGFVTDLSENFLLVIHEDDYIVYGNCKQQINSLKTD